ncbi:MAG: hypothetical protein ACR2OZ_03920 [Verrucomicrobiales bacterium]
MNRIFLLSPAHSGGKRARFISNPKASFELAHRLQKGGTASIGEIFSFLSGLYFRGKLTYANAFARAPLGVAPAQVITSNRGLVDARMLFTLGELEALGTVNIDVNDSRYRDPLDRDVGAFASTFPDCEVVLLGSVATGKYVDILLNHFRKRLLFPTDFVGRGDMSRGGLLLRSVADNRELPYAPVGGAVIRGNRPPRLPPIQRKTGQLNN